MTSTFVQIDGTQHPVTIKGDTASIPANASGKLAEKITAEIYRLYPDVNKCKFKPEAENELVKQKPKKSRKVDKAKQKVKSSDPQGA